MTRIDFSYNLRESALVGRLIYRESEYSIDFIDYSCDEVLSMAGSEGCCSLVAGTLQIEVGVETGRLIYPWGFCPLINSTPKSIPMKPIECGAIYIDTKKTKLTAGVAIEFPESSSWEIFKDIETRWICIGSYDMSKNIRLIQFSKNSIISFNGSNAIAIWIRPEIET